MNIIFLTQVSGFLKPFAWVMGVILDAIYKFVGLFGSTNIALCIVLFTFVIKMLMLPLTIKQQKYTRLSSKMSPELKKIQDKYKGKKDEESLRRQNAETQELYAKYGTSPIGGCLPLLISLPIMFALYRVIYAIPAYVTEIGGWYGQIADAVSNISGHADAITTFITDNGIKITNNLSTYAVGSEQYRNSLIDILAKFSPANWDAFFSSGSFSGLKANFSATVDSIIKAHNFFGLSILDTPTWKEVSKLPSLLIPVLAVVTQMIQTRVAMANNNTQNQKSTDDNPMANSMKSMNTIMPIMSGVFCLMLPIGVGIYWIASAVFTILQTIFINKYIDKADLDEMIEKNVEKANKKKESLGVKYGNQMAEVAKTSTKVYSNDDSYDNTAYKKNNKKKSVSGGDYKRSSVSYSASSIAANANLLARNNEARHEAKTEEKPNNTIEKTENVNTDNADISENTSTSSDSANDQN
ncbi:MAG: YidC/Oxa1 family membrane protein insertase [Lachnospiraceae bacterium]|nr:YidC/Oxa1 family membrane protein insertase [Lachnospiraceae bacterium]